MASQHVAPTSAAPTRAVPPPGYVDVPLPDSDWQYSDVSLPPGRPRYAPTNFAEPDGDMSYQDAVLVPVPEHAAPTSSSTGASEVPAEPAAPTSSSTGAPAAPTSSSTGASEVPAAGFQCVLQPAEPVRAIMSAVTSHQQRAVQPAANASSDVLVVANPSNEVVHMYSYTSTGVKGTAVVNLRQTGNVRTIEFVFMGNLSDEHGSWSMSDCGSIMKLWFNARYREVARADGMYTMFHPTIVYKDGCGQWEGVDDKGWQITLKHIRSIAKNGRSWMLTDSL